MTDQLPLELGPITPWTKSLLTMGPECYRPFLKSPFKTYEVIFNDLDRLETLLRYIPPVKYINTNNLDSVVAEIAVEKVSNLLITGRAGAGKTTFIVKLLEQFKNFTAVILDNSFNELQLEELINEDLKGKVFIIWDNFSNKFSLFSHLVKALGKVRYHPFIICACEGDLSNKHGEEGAFCWGSFKHINLWDLDSREKKRLIEFYAKEHKITLDLPTKELLVNTSCGTPFYIISILQPYKNKEITDEEILYLPDNINKFWEEQFNRLNREEKSLLYLLRFFNDFCLQPIKRAVISAFECLSKDDNFQTAFESLKNKGWLEEKGDLIICHPVKLKCFVTNLREKDVIKKLSSNSSLSGTDKESLCHRFISYYHQEEKLDDEIELYKHMLKLNGDDGRIYYNIGLVYEQMSNYEKAMEHYDKNLKIAADDYKTYNNLGITLAKNKCYPKAIEYFQKAASIEEKPLILANLALSYFFTKEYEKIIEIAETCLGDDVVFCGLAGIAYYETKAYDRAVEMFQKIFSLNPNDDNNLLNLAKASSLSKKYREAIAVYNYLQERIPDKSDIYEGLGVCYLNLKQYKEAVEIFERYLSLEPSNSRVYFNLGRAYIQSGQYEKAIENYRKAQKIDPNYPEIYNDLGVSYLHSGRYANAVEMFQKSLNLDPSNAIVYNNLGVTHMRLREHKEAENMFRKALQIEAKPGIYTNLAFTYGEMGNYLEAVSMFKESLALEECPKTYNNLGVMYIYTSEYEEARKVFQQALRLEPANSKFHINLGTACLHLELYEEAVKEFRKAISLEPKNANAYYNLACCYSKKGDVWEALQALRISVQLGFPDIDFVMEDPDLANIKDKDEFKELFDSRKKIKEAV